MRTLSCPHCSAAVQFSWGDFFIVNNRGSATLHCLGCGKTCTTNSAARIMALLASLLVIGVPVYVILLFDLFSLPGWFRATALIVAISVFMGVRALFIAKFTKKLVTY